MRTLEKLKYLLVVLTLPILMSGCLKSDDPSFTCNGKGYIFQKELHGTPYYAVFLYMVANEPLKKAEYYLDNPYMTTPLSQIYNTGIWEIPEHAMRWEPSIPKGTYHFVATNANAEITNNSYTFNIDKPLGEIDLKKFEIKGENISMELNKAVENATGYYLMFTVGAKSSADAIPEFHRSFSNYRLWNESRPMELSASLNLRDVINRANNGFAIEEDAVIYVAFAAVRSTTGGSALIQETPYREITLKSEEDLLQ